MAATWKDYSTTTASALIPNWPVIYGQVHSELLDWLAAANAQNPTQRLELVAGPWDDADPCGWTIKARLEEIFPATWPTEALRGQPVELISTWVFSPQPRFFHSYGLAADWNPIGTDGTPHGSLAGLYWTTTGYGYINAAPILVFSASSLIPGAEFFLLACWEGLTQYRNITPLLISKDQASNQWALFAAPPATSETLKGITWNRRARQAVKVEGVISRGSSPGGTGRFRTLTRAMPSPSVASPADAVLHLDRCLLPPELRTGSPGLGSWVRCPDGSGWMGAGGGLLVCLQDPEVS